MKHKKIIKKNNFKIGVLDFSLFNNFLEENTIDIFFFEKIDIFT